MRLTGDKTPEEIEQEIANAQQDYRMRMQDLEDDYRRRMQELQVAYDEAEERLRGEKLESG